MRIMKNSFVFILLAALAGCATLPKSIPVPESEADQVAAAYNNLLVGQKDCWEVIDADASVVLSNLISKGTIKGYFQAMAPKYIRFEVLNPLGLVEALLVTDGTDFDYLAAREQKAYRGGLDADKLAE